MTNASANMTLKCDHILKSSNIEVIHIKTQTNIILWNLGKLIDFYSECWQHLKCWPFQDGGCVNVPGVVECGIYISFPFTNCYNQTMPTFISVYTTVTMATVYPLKWNSYNNPHFTVCNAMDNKHVFHFSPQVIIWVTAKLFFCILKTGGYIQSEDNKE